jgi:hypothetical protein
MYVYFLFNRRQLLPMGASQSAPAHEEFKAGAAHHDDLCCAHRNSIRRNREDVKQNNRDSGQQYENETFSKQGSDGNNFFKQVSGGIRVPLFNPASPPANKKPERQEIDGRRNSQGSVIPTWLRDPEPLPDWTPEQQRVFISQLDENPLSRKHHGHLKRAMEKTHRLLPEKSIDEIERCYRHLQHKRIAYFGKEDGRQSPATGKTYP